jgi:hypothetical protein
MVLGAMAGAASGYLAGLGAGKPVADALALRPPVAVLALAGELDALPPERWDARLRERAEVAARLARAGYLVLDAQAVIGGPPDIYVDPEGAPASTLPAPPPAAAGPGGVR